MASKGFFLAALVALFVSPIANAQLSFDTRLIDFGTVEVGDSATTSVVLSNVGTESAMIRQISLEGDFVSTSYCPAELYPGESCDIQIDFTPSKPGKYHRNLELKYEIGDKNDEIKVKIRAITPKIAPQKLLSFNTSLVDFGTVTVGDTATTSVVLSNIGTAMATIRDISLKGDFVVTSFCPVELYPGENCQIQIDFVPRRPGNHKRDLEVEYRDAYDNKNEIEVEISGRSVKAATTQSCKE